jgi:hypothetical protein
VFERLVSGRLFVTWKKLGHRPPATTLRVATKRRGLNELKQPIKHPPL